MSAKTEKTLNHLKYLIFCNKGNKNEMKLLVKKKDDNNILVSYK